MLATKISPQSNEKSSCPREEHQLSTQVRCFVYMVDSDCFRAECIDLDIAAEGRTAREARRGLRDSILGYVNVVCEEHAETLHETTEKKLRKLILRPAPLTHRIHYYVAKFLQTAFPKRQSHTRNRVFEFAAPCGL